MRQAPLYPSTCSSVPWASSGHQDQRRWYRQSTHTGPAQAAPHAQQVRPVPVPLQPDHDHPPSHSSCSAHTGPLPNPGTPELPHHSFVARAPSPEKPCADPCRGQPGHRLPGQASLMLRTWVSLCPGSRLPSVPAVNLCICLSPT